MDKRINTLKLIVGVIVQLILIISFAFVDVAISPYLYLIVWCMCAKMVIRALTFERVV